MKQAHAMAPLAAQVTEFGREWLAVRRDYDAEYGQHCVLGVPRALRGRPGKGGRLLPGSDRFIQKAKEALQESLGSEAPEAVASYYCFPAARGLPVLYSEEWKADYRLQEDLLTLCEHFLLTQSNFVARRLLFQRFRGIVTNTWPDELTVEILGLPEDTVLRNWHRMGAYDAPYLSPGVSDLSDILSLIIVPDEHRSEVNSLLAGQWNVRVTVDPKKGPVDSMTAYGRSMWRLFEVCALDAFSRGAFDYGLLCRLADFHPFFVKAIMREPKRDGKLREILDVSKEKLAKLAECWSWELYQSLPLDQSDEEEDYSSRQDRYRAHELILDSHSFAGIRWLVKTCEHVEDYGLTEESLGDYHHPVRKIIGNAAAVCRFTEGESEDDLKRELARFKPDTLWLLLPYARLGQKAIFEVLSAEALLPLHEYLVELSGVDKRSSYMNVPFLGNSDSETSGVLDLQGLETSARGVPKQLIERYFRAMCDSKLGYSRLCYLCEAGLGFNVEKVKVSAKRQVQVSLKALGLIPFSSPDEVIERYIALRKAWKDSSKYGAERQANTRAAATVGLKNLAQRAGYRDVTRMEWDLESALSEKAETALRPRQMGDWEVEVEIQGLKARLRVEKHGKPLKSVPAGLRKHPDYGPLREQMKTLDEQARRFRKALEDMMCEGETLDAPELRKLAGIAAVRFLMANLIGIDSSGQVGLINAQASTLTSLDGQVQPIDGALRIAHVHDLYQLAELSGWQRRVVDCEIVQPFKQAFRELYVMTPAERESSPKSHRYEGRTIDTSVAYRLLQSRGWGIWGSEGDGCCERIFSEHGLSARWEFPGVHHFFSENETETADVIAFYQEGETVPLDQVNPLLFSEVMRDADLVVSVAAVSDEGEYWSSGLGAARVAVVGEVARKLGFENLSFEGNFVYVRGKRATYRIHMGSGNIHIMPGAYLCVVPERDSKSKPIYLPFADADRKTSEILSKVILLSDDDRIKDPTIVSQIENALNRAAS